MRDNNEISPKKGVKTPEEILFDFVPNYFPDNYFSLSVLVNVANKYADQFIQPANYDYAVKLIEERIKEIEDEISELHEGFYPIHSTLSELKNLLEKIKNQDNTITPNN